VRKFKCLNVVSKDVRCKLLISFLKGAEKDDDEAGRELFKLAFFCYHQIA